MKFELGMRVLVFDPLKFIDDIKTPLAVTMCPATVIRQYNLEDGREVIDVNFDHRGLSKAHFTNCVEFLG